MARRIDDLLIPALIDHDASYCELRPPTRYEFICVPNATPRRFFHTRDRFPYEMASFFRARIAESVDALQRWVLDVFVAVPHYEKEHRLAVAAAVGSQGHMFQGFFFHNQNWRTIEACSEIERDVRPLIAAFEIGPRLPGGCTLYEGLRSLGPVPMELSSQADDATLRWHGGGETPVKVGDQWLVRRMPVASWNPDVALASVDTDDDVLFAYTFEKGSEVRAIHEEQVVSAGRPGDERCRILVQPGTMARVTAFRRVRVERWGTPPVDPHSTAKTQAVRVWLVEATVMRGSTLLQDVFKNVS
jgi:hypothetical protein